MPPLIQRDNQGISQQALQMRGGRGRLNATAVGELLRGERTPFHEQR